MPTAALTYQLKPSAGRRSWAWSLLREPILYLYSTEKRAETVFLTGSWTTQAQRSILTSIILRHELAQLRHWKPDENGPCNQQVSGLWMSCICTEWLCMTGNDLELHQFLLLSKFKQDLVTNLFRLRQFWAASKTSKQLENSGIK